MRKQVSFTVTNTVAFKEALLEWSSDYDHIVWLDSNEHHDSYGNWDAILAVSGQNDKSSNFINTIGELHDFVGKKQDWLFGFITYDIKNRLENLNSNNHDGLDFPELQFFIPEKIIAFKGDVIHFFYIHRVEGEINLDFDEITSRIGSISERTANPNAIGIRLRIHKDSYYEKTNRLLGHIHRGDIYEANFCQEFFSENITINPLDTYKNLNQISAAPFASFLKSEDKYLMCASPERYLARKGNLIVSQPIKGTAPRGTNQKEDKDMVQQLQNDPKERAENIMITDLVRNDLSKSALKGTVEVKELCKVYSFKQVHQMISTVVSKVPKDLNSVQLLRDSFPMGSMTGAPKISAMKIIEELEETKRGLYSGSVGYFDPEGNFDLNVVIRSILYNATKKYVSFSVGGAITAKSDPDKEYQECLLKAKAMRSVLEGS